MAAAVYGGCDDDGDDDVFFCVCDDIGMLVAVVYGCDDVGMLFMAAVMMMLMARMRNTAAVYGCDDVAMPFMAAAKLRLILPIHIQCAHAPTPLMHTSTSSVAFHAAVYGG
eukprot:800196-Rhodomonas_salina.2